jgi:hypothetical protein
MLFGETVTVYCEKNYMKYKNALWGRISVLSQVVHIVTTGGQRLQ